jgi:hypothetical protein
MLRDSVPGCRPGLERNVRTVRNPHCSKLCPGPARAHSAAIDGIYIVGLLQCLLHLKTKRRRERQRVDTCLGFDFQTRSNRLSASNRFSILETARWEEHKRCGNESMREPGHCRAKWNHLSGTHFECSWQLAPRVTDSPRTQSGEVSMRFCRPELGVAAEIETTMLAGGISNLPCTEIK